MDQARQIYEAPKDLMKEGSASTYKSAEPSPWDSPSWAAWVDIPHLSLDSPPPNDLLPSVGPRQPCHPPLPPFLTLPNELIELIAFALCDQVPLGPPTTLAPLLLVNRHFYDVLGPRNDGFYSDLFKQRFDWKSVERRWTTMRNAEDKREKRSLLDGVTVRPDDALKLTYGSFTRPSSPSDVPHSTSPWRPLTSRDYAIEFKRRCVVLTRMRTAAQTGVIPPNSSRPSSPRLEPLSAPGHYKSSLGEPDDLTQNLWTCYLMLLEN
ncbi:hypothetical protein P7C70_g7510, partial [Phenoliferia sp. Uapishka_3]